MSDRGEKDERPRSRWRDWWARRFGPADQDKASEEAITELADDGLIDLEESEMMQSILVLDKTTVWDVMVPRTEIIFMDKGTSLRQILDCFIRDGHSRIIVTDKSLDNAVGYLHVKDLLQYWGKEGEFQLDRVMRKLYVVPETKKLDDLLTEFQERGEQFALVIDEFGGTSGLVSIEDILEEIVGEIKDEYDEDEPRVLEHSGDTVTVPGRFEIEKLSEELGVAEPAGSFNTVGGWIFERIGRVPTAGEKFVFDGLEAVIEAASERQIRRVRLHKAPPPPAEE